MKRVKKIFEAILEDLENPDHQSNIEDIHFANLMMVSELARQQNIANKIAWMQAFGSDDRLYQEVLDELA